VRRQRRLLHRARTLVRVVLVQSRDEIGDAEMPPLLSRRVAAVQLLCREVEQREARTGKLPSFEAPLIKFKFHKNIEPQLSLEGRRRTRAEKLRRPRPPVCVGARQHLSRNAIFELIS
jgi:hypothetical protein